MATVTYDLTGTRWEHMSPEERWIEAGKLRGETLTHEDWLHFSGATPAQRRRQAVLDRLADAQDRRLGRAVREAVGA